MPTPASRAEEVAERLTATGLTPEVKDQKNHFLVEAKVPAQASPESWKGLLGALETADHFGQEVSAGGMTVWAAIRKGTPAAAPAARGHGRQL
ncbi:hypothetical protein DB35_03630 [Streptomyces abyssalis]|uniref:Uncharacterized protein n=1 Tax=Streptomyces abyssalis TaxID=933944 RepID=A0A1E7JQ32_9ACTN|nr:hypothetical protein [Streptomyces abyssalis]OEU90355.1 hypothetical protein AN215_12745 [Streptomyces abyssalis]OEU95092.1 hypothetical protein DB35_03630 [Streptomyces abyssalis]